VCASWEETPQITYEEGLGIDRRCALLSIPNSRVPTLRFIDERRKVRRVKAHRERVTNDTAAVEPSILQIVTPRCSSKGTETKPRRSSP
jgi:hypothetical protein